MSTLLHRCTGIVSLVIALGLAVPSWAQVPSTVPTLPPSGPSAVPASPSAVPALPGTGGKPKTAGPSNTPPANPGNPPAATNPGAVPSMVPSLPGQPSTVPALPSSPAKPTTTNRPQASATKPAVPAVQPKPDPAPANNPRTNNKKNDLEPQPLSLRTRDGIQLSGMYFPSDKGKKAVPVMLVHEAGGQTGAFRDFALRLQGAGFAVAYIDLRGHGGSTQRVDPLGNLIPWQPKGMTKRDVAAMVQGDLESLKGFLKEENDREKLNLNSLVLLGIGEGAILAMNWAMIDWNYPSIPGKKQGQDVKGLVLLSPAKLYEGVSYLPATEHAVVSRLPTMILSGKDADKPEAEKMQKLLNKTRSGPSGAGVGALDARVLPTSLAGSRLLTTPSIAPSVTELITGFLIQNIANLQDRNPWIQRSRE